MLRSLLPLLFLPSAYVAVLGGGDVEIGWGWGTPPANDISASQLHMICSPAASACPNAATAPDTVQHTAVHSLLRTDMETDERTSINTWGYKTRSLPKSFAPGPCGAVTADDATPNASMTALGDAPPMETFTMTYVASELKHTEISGQLFSSRTHLIRRPDLSIGSSTGLMATHDDFDLSDNWDIEGQTNKDGTVFSGPTRFFQQWFMFDQHTTVPMGDANLTVRPCDLLHLFHFVRHPNSWEVKTSADWKFRKLEGVNPFDQEDFVLSAKVALRKVDNDTIGVEVEQQHFLQKLGVNASEVGLPEYHDAQTGNSYYRMYEWKSTVYCSQNTNDTTAIPQLTKVDTASFDVALQTYVDSAEETARGIPAGGNWNSTEGDGSTMRFYYIPADGRPLIFRNEPNGKERHHIHLNLRWHNLPAVTSCPVLVWDPTFLPLPPTGGSGGSAVFSGAGAKAGVVGGSLLLFWTAAALVVM